uniref:Ig-like domain-containing protein n=1 Tax=Timema monikensis TaxID=170555 RepID=A0A7R9E4H5_9NEOP|nr:unnamed protein product [Timema monikensis]
MWPSSPYELETPDSSLPINCLIVDGILDGQGPLLMLEPPPRLEFSNNSGGRLDCSARGSPTPNLQWMMSDGSPASTVTGLRYQLSNGTLVFPPFSAADFRPDVHHAIYRCVASNSLGRVISRDVRLRAGIGKVELEEVNPHLRGEVHPTEIRTLISPSSAVELNTTSALANYATQAGWLITK